MSTNNEPGIDFDTFEFPDSVRFFNTAGPVKEKKHYTIDSLSRINIKEIITLIQDEKYFVLHAPRQTGKTSLMLTLMEFINKSGRYNCLYTNVESAQAAREKVDRGIRAILDVLSGMAADYLHDTYLKKNWHRILDESGALSALYTALKEWSKNSTKPLVLIIDEIDSLVGDTLISVLRQLRTGYPERPEFFPQSIILCGVRDVRDYRIYSDSEKSIITGGSAFNIKAESLQLGNFSYEEIEKLYKEHTKETGQVFDDDVFPLTWELTEGQPWLVNALAYEACFKIEEGKDRDRVITAGIINQAKENLIIRRETHLDQLANKLKEERVRKVIEPFLASSKEPEILNDDDIDYVADLGLIVRKPQLRIANNIYREIIPRQITYSTQLTISENTAWYVDEIGCLDMDKLLTSFQDFFRQHFEHWVEGFNYSEAGPQLFLQAFLQRIVNGGGQVEREYGLGKERTDLLVIWPHPKGVQRIVLELKIRYGSLEKTIEKAIEQTWKYMDKCNTGEGYLLIFDRSKKASWKQKIFTDERNYNDTTIKIFGM